MAVQSIELSMKTIDHTFRLLGYVPLVSSISGSIRAYYGIAEIVAAVAIGVFATIAASSAAAPLFGTLMISGIFDILRGNVEQIPVIGNAACIVYDLARFTIFII